MHIFCGVVRHTTESQTSTVFESLASEDGSGSIVIQHLSSAPAAAGREAALAAENKDLVVRLTTTHRKLKLLRCRSQQREAMQEAKVLCYLRSMSLWAVHAGDSGRLFNLQCF